MQKGRARYLTAGDFVVRRRSIGIDTQTAAARSQFIEAIQCRVPRFFEELREAVYPEYARTLGVPSKVGGRSASLPDKVQRVVEKSDFRRFRKLQNARDARMAGAKPHPGVIRVAHQARKILSDPSIPFVPILMKWARKFNVDGEEWILEAALQKLSSWHRFPERYPESHRNLETVHFRQTIAGLNPVLPPFEFRHNSPDLTRMTFTEWCKSAKKRFSEDLAEYERQVCAIAKKRGLIKTDRRFSPEHFEWLALFQCGSQSLESICKCSNVEKTTVSKGMHNAAELARITIRITRPKLNKT